MNVRGQALPAMQQHHDYAATMYSLYTFMDLSVTIIGKVLGTERAAAVATKLLLLCTWGEDVAHTAVVTVTRCMQCLAPWPPENSSLHCLYQWYML